MPLGDSGINPGLEASDPARALQDAVRRGESFSGNERHVVLRNDHGRPGPSGSKPFVDVSGVSGLDLPDDGRAACFTDWDSDGDLDLWVSNRGAPGLRFFQNENPSAGRGLTLKLVGADGNRDAIGARVVLSAKREPPQSRTVTAGSGFLAQSGKTVHFGLGRDAEIEAVVVHWPGGDTQTLAGIRAGAYTVAQGSEPREIIEIRGNIARESEAPPAQPPPNRTLLAGRLPVATVFERPPEADGKALLVALTSDSCAHCTAQIAEWESAPPAGVVLRTLSIEGLEADTPERLRLMRIAHDHPFDIRDRPAPTPLSFLIDPDDRLCAIYRGRVDAGVLAGDISNLSLEGEALRDASLPFVGIWASAAVPAARPLSFAEDLIDAGLLGAAGRYIEHYRDELRRDPLFEQLLARLNALR